MSRRKAAGNKTKTILNPLSGMSFIFLMTCWSREYKAELSGISCQRTPWISRLYYQGDYVDCFLWANLADFLTTWWMFTLAHMGLRQLTHNPSLYNEVNDAREVPENTPSFFFFFKKRGWNPCSGNEQRVIFELNLWWCHLCLWMELKTWNKWEGGLPTALTQPESSWLNVAMEVHQIYKYI